MILIIYLNFTDIVGVLQAIVALISVVLLFRTILLHRDANKYQKDLLEMEVKAKRAEYMPAYSVHIGIVHTNHIEDGFGGYIPGDECALYFKLEVKENTITRIETEFENPDKLVFQKVEYIGFNNGFYKKGDKLEQHLVVFKFSDYEVLLIENKEADLLFFLTIRFEDMVGNKYIQNVIYNFKNSRTESLPLISDEP